MSNQILFFSLPKKLEQNQNIQDAHNHSNDNMITAIADGASTSLLSREWADLLVEHFCQGQDPKATIKEKFDNWKEWLKPVQKKWFQKFIDLKNSSQPWNVKGSENKDSASATFIGLKLYPPDEKGERIYEAMAVGDSCLFHINSNQPVIFKSFPIQPSETFPASPHCFFSRDEMNQYTSNPHYMTESYQENDIFLLATDALAESILKDDNKKGNLLEKLTKIRTEQEFSALIESLRSKDQIKNDDTSLCLLKIETTSPSPSPTLPIIPSEKSSSGNQQKSSEVKTSDQTSTSEDGLNSDDNIKTQKNNDQNQIDSHAKQTLQGLLSKVAGYGQRILITLIFFISLSHFLMYLFMPPKNNEKTSHEFPFFPVYDGKDTSHEKPIGYLFKKPSQSSTILLSILVPNKDIKQSNVIIPETTNTYIYINIPKPGKLNIEYVSGVLLPGNYTFSEPSPSIKLNGYGYRWIKIQAKINKINN